MHRIQACDHWTQGAPSKLEKSIGNHTQSVKLVLLIHVTLHVEVAATITGPKQSVTLHVEVATTV